MHGMCVNVKSPYLVQMFVLVLLLLGLHVNHVKNDNNFLKRKYAIHTFFCIAMHILNLQFLVHIISREFLKMIYKFLKMNFFVLVSKIFL
jgi:hypothetical protein